MVYGEDNFDQLPSIDKELARELARLNEFIEEDIRDQLGDDAYDEYQEMKKLDESANESLDKEMKDAIAKDQTDAAEWLVSKNRKASEMPEQLRSRRWYDDYIEAFTEVAGDLTDKIDLLLLEKYSGLEVASLNGGIITYYLPLPQKPGDKEKGIIENIMISFTTHGQDITTSVAHLHESTPLTGRMLVREEIDIDSLGGQIEGISIDGLKSDTLKFIKMILRPR